MASTPRVEALEHRMAALLGEVASDAGFAAALAPASPPPGAKDAGPDRTDAAAAGASGSPAAASRDPRPRSRTDSELIDDIPEEDEGPHDPSDDREVAATNDNLTPPPAPEAARLGAASAADSESPPAAVLLRGDLAAAADLRALLAGHSAAWAERPGPAGAAPTVEIEGVAVGGVEQLRDLERGGWLRPVLRSRAFALGFLREGTPSAPRPDANADDNNVDPGPTAVGVPEPEPCLTPEKHGAGELEASVDGTPLPAEDGLEGLRDLPGPTTGSALARSDGAALVAATWRERPWTLFNLRASEEAEEALARACTRAQDLAVAAQRVLEGGPSPEKNKADPEPAVAASPASQPASAHRRYVGMENAPSPPGRQPPRSSPQDSALVDRTNLADLALPDFAAAEGFCKDLTDLLGVDEAATTGPPPGDAFRHFQEDEEVAEVWRPRPGRALATPSPRRTTALQAVVTTDALNEHAAKILGERTPSPLRESVDLPASPALIEAAGFHSDHKDRIVRWDADNDGAAATAGPPVRQPPKRVTFAAKGESATAPDGGDPEEASAPAAAPAGPAGRLGALGRRAAQVASRCALGLAAGLLLAVAGGKVTVAGFNVKPNFRVLRRRRRERALTCVGSKQPFALGVRERGGAWSPFDDAFLRVEECDTLWGLAGQLLNDPAEWRTLYRALRGAGVLRDPRSLVAGMAVPTRGLRRRLRQAARARGRNSDAIVTLWRAGDSLPGIADEIYGSPDLWPRIAECNGIGEGESVAPGTPIRLP